MPYQLLVSADPSKIWEDPNDKPRYGRIQLAKTTKDIDSENSESTSPPRPTLSENQNEAADPTPTEKPPIEKPTEVTTLTTEHMDTTPPMKTTEAATHAQVESDTTSMEL